MKRKMHCGSVEGLVWRIDPMGQSIVVENRWKDNTVLHLYSPAGT